MSNLTAQRISARNTKTAFTLTGLGHFELLTSLMGLIGCPASLQQLDAIFLKQVICEEIFTGLGFIFEKSAALDGRIENCDWLH